MKRKLTPDAATARPTPEIKCPFCTRLFSTRGSNQHQKACRVKYHVRRAARRRNKNAAASGGGPCVKRQRIGDENEYVPSGKFMVVLRED